MGKKVQLAIWKNKSRLLNKEPHCLQNQILPLYSIQKTVRQKNSMSKFELIWTDFP